MFYGTVGAENFEGHSEIEVEVSFPGELSGRKVAPLKDEIVLIEN